MKRLPEKSPLLIICFRKLGDEWDVKDELHKDLEAFTCLMYGYKREKSLNVVRSLMLNKMVGQNAELSSKSKDDLSRLPPCHSNLIPHIQRVNHRLANYKRSHLAIVWRPKPNDPGQGWRKTENDVLEPLWSTGPILPISLIDILEETSRENDEEHDNDVEEIDYDELFSDEED